MNYVIIGNSAAAIACVESIRKIDKTSSIKMISEENYLAYSRPLIAEYFSDSISDDKMWYRNNKFYEINNIELILGSKVIAIDPINNSVTSDTNQIINYDRLLIATGGTPFVPPIEGSKAEGVYTFVRWDEVKRIYENKSEIKKAVVIGGGLIGLKAAEHLTKSGIQVTMVELADSVLSLVLDDISSSVLQDHFESNGVKIITNNTVSRVQSSDNKVTGVILKDNTEIECDAVVIAIGVIPNIDIVGDSGIDTNKGILVNNHMQTNFENIFAAGDVAEGTDMLLNQKRVLPIWPVAYAQGAIAGYNMAGVERVYSGGLSMNSLEFFNLPIISAGYHSKPDETTEEEFVFNERKKIYKKIIYKDNKLIGFIYVNKIDRAGILTGLIKDKTDISQFKDEILKDSFGLINIPKEILEEKISLAVSAKNQGEPANVI